MTPQKFRLIAVEAITVAPNLSAAKALSPRTLTGYPAGLGLRPGHDRKSQGPYALPHHGLNSGSGTLLKEVR